MIESLQIAHLVQSSVAGDPAPEYQIIGSALDRVRHVRILRGSIAQADRDGLAVGT